VHSSTLSAELDDLSEIHHRDPVADMGYGGEVMADEQIADCKGVLEMLAAELVRK